MPTVGHVTPKTLGAQLTLAMMKRMGLNQTDFAELLGLPRAKLRRYLTGDVTVTLKLACMIFDFSQGEVPFRSWLLPPHQPPVQHSGGRRRKKTA